MTSKELRVTNSEHNDDSEENDDWREKEKEKELAQSSRLTQSIPLEDKRRETFQVHSGSKRDREDSMDNSQGFTTSIPNKIKKKKKKKSSK